ncbi:hypothetical protein [Streptomyces sp. NPDC088180]|uniref:hypothetical protein n=1 Tax=Streptomyces sp. NPDC088180 TaxID=3365837 RepID=UPI00381ED0ED
MQLPAVIRELAPERARGEQAEPLAVHDETPVAVGEQRLDPLPDTAVAAGLDSTM